MIRQFLFIFLFLLLSGFTLRAQTYNCTPPSASAELDVNNVRALIQNGGDMWWDLVGLPKYEVPKGSGLHSFFTHSLWIGGWIYGSGILGLAANTYRQSGVDYFAGPLDTNGVPIDTSCVKFDSVWAVSKSEIEQHLAGIHTSKNIMNWPACGNPSINMPYMDLAPFIDVDSNGIYEADKGDYPDIKGDKALWWVFNDKGNLHTGSGGNYIGVEVQVMAYAYAGVDPLNSTTFYDYKILNKDRSILDTYIGLFVDFDLGNSHDDFAACDTIRNMGIGYNGDAFDEGPLGYGAYPPVVGVKTVKNPKVNSGQSYRMSGFMVFNNDASVTGTPNSPAGFYNYLHSVWRDGQPLIHGGTGHPNSVSPPYDTVSYMFDGTPSDTNSWSECQASNPPFDRRFVMNYGPMDFLKGDTISFSMAAIYTRDFDVADPCDYDFSIIKSAADEIQSFVDTAWDCSGFNPLFQAYITDPDSGMSNGSVQLVFSSSVPDVLWSTGDTSLTISNLDDGIYTLLMSNDFNCYQSIDFVVGLPVSVEDLPDVGVIEMFPNPATDELTIVVEEGGYFGVVLDLSGREVMRFRINAPQTVLSIRDLQAGTYLIRISRGGKSVYKKLMVMQ